MSDYHNIHDQSSRQLIDAHSTITPLTGIKLCHFGTKPSLIPSHLAKDHLVSRYGYVMYKIPYDVIIKRYLQARQKYSKGKDECMSITYRVAYTQIYQKEINHMMMIGCDSDKELDAFPAIVESENLTQYCTPTKKITLNDTSYSAVMSQYLYKKKRHEDLTLSFYLPDDCQVSLSREDYTESVVEHDPEWCHVIFKSPYFSGQCPSEVRNKTRKQLIGSLTR